MSSHLAAKPPARQNGCEPLEERLAFSVNAIGELPELLQFSATSPQEFAPLVSLANPAEQIDQIRENYSFNGTGQTVAIIDSGIAWDHFALGGGLGKDFRVVGGWDFAENDSDPFDDGPAGYHGTHVAGIVGSSDENHPGVASGVDLVGLRVFDDRGGGKLRWVEEALQWVHDHRNDFENPITTVNLSLGVHWNSNSVPGWATLEDEFAQLRRDGIFISVAAGNSFQNHLSKGVSYPAASPYVVPVASHDAWGQLSDFSQRNERVLVAPGEDLESTIPGHLYGQLGPSSRFLAASGTSMAAPYVAGASVLLREALEIAGESRIDQSTLYSHFQRTADQVYDSLTQSWYSRLDLTAAIDSALQDPHGDQPSSASRLGRISKLQSIEGILAKTRDVDYMRFEADESGQVSLTLHESHELKTMLDVVDQKVSRNGNRVSFQVTAGEEYLIRLHAGAGKGNYRVNVEFDSATPGIVNLGRVRSDLFSNLGVSGQSHYRITASRQGILTVESQFEAARGPLQMEILNLQGEVIASGQTQQEGSRVDIEAAAGESYIIRLMGSNQDVELKCTNLVRTVRDRLIIGGTGQQDSYTYVSDQTHQATVNGTRYEFSKDAFRKVRIHGGTGSDEVFLTGSQHRETLSGGQGRVVFYGDQTDVIAGGFESVRVDARGGDDLAVLQDSNQSDTFHGNAERSRLTGGGYLLVAEHFERVTAISSSGGSDQAILTGTSGDDFLHVHSEGTSLGGASYRNYVIGFDSIVVEGGSGADNALLRGTAENETFRASPGEMQFQNSTGVQRFQGFESVVVHSGGGNDRAQLAQLGSGDRIRRDGGNLQGVVYGTDLLLSAYQEVEWSNGAGVIKEIALSVVDGIFDDYARN
ncbi:MAG: S8 family serine peptidase [Planctomycetota bacterium]|nr:S8 family serine peptidase [Planctomycetota bacterium]